MNLNPFKPFSQYLKPYRGQIALGLVLLFLSLAISLTIPKLLQWGIEVIELALRAENPEEVEFRTGSVEGDLAFYAGIIAGFSLLNWLLSIGMRYYLTIVSRKVERDIRSAYVNHLLHLPLA